MVINDWTARSAASRSSASTRERSAIAELALHDGQGRRVALPGRGGDGEGALPARCPFLE